MSKAKPIFTLFLGLYLIILLINLIFPLSSFAQTEEEEETLTIATYYPAPYGIYNEMRAKKMAVGDNYHSGSAYPWDTGGGCAGNEICNADLVVEGNVGIGTASPDESLQVNGKIKMVDGNQAAGKVLTSDANGTGSWQTAAPVQAGEAITDASGFLTVTFAVPFLNTPIVVTSTIGDARIVGVQTRTPTEFTVRSLRSEDNATKPNVPFYWIATLGTN